MSIATEPAVRLSPITAAARQSLFTEARTANTFTDQPVGDDQLHEIYELAKFGPTSANTSPLRILFLRPGPGRERLLPYMTDRNRGKTGTAPVVAVLANDLAFHERIPELLPHRPELRDDFAADDVLRESTAAYNGALQAAYVIVAIRAVGLAAGPMAGFDRDGVDAEFFADSTWRSQLVINIGHPGPDAWYGRLPRLAFDDAVRFA